MVVLAFADFFIKYFSIIFPFLPYQIMEAQIVKVQIQNILVEQTSRPAKVLVVEWHARLNSIEIFQVQVVCHTNPIIFW